MSSTSSLDKWVSLGLITAEQAQSIREHEKQKGSSRLFAGLAGIGTLAIILGCLSLIASNWAAMTSEVKILTHLGVNLGLAGIIFFAMPRPSWLREILVAVLAGLFLTFIALTGQILQTQALFWKPIGAWLILSTPLLFFWARSFWVAKGWLVAVIAFLVFLTPEMSRQTLEYAWVALPFTLYALSRLTFVQKAIPNWAQSWKTVFWFVVFIVASLAQLGWRIPIGQPDIFMALGSFWKQAYHLIPFFAMTASAVACALLVALNILARRGLLPFWDAPQKPWDIVLLGSLGFTLAPLLIPHGEWPALGATFFCLYWLFLGIMGLRTGQDRLWSLAMFLISVRLFIVYVEIFGSLAIQGIGFILSGVLLLVLVGVTRKLMRNKPQWLKTIGGEA